MTRSTRFPLRIGIVLLTCAALLLPADLQKPAVAAGPTADEVRNSIERGKRYLISKQNPNGTWTVGGVQLWTAGVTSLTLLALLNCGMTIKDKPIENGINWLRKLPDGEPDTTYEISLMISALVAANDGDRDKARILSLAKRLEDMQGRSGESSGAWHYTGGSGGYDHSNSQFAVLGLREAAVAGIPIRRETWQRIHDHWVDAQSSNGGWGYTKSHPPSGSMTVAGIATLVITETMLSESQDLNADGTLRCCQPDESNEPLERGLKWLEKNFSVGRNPFGGGSLLYYLYGVERAGRLGGRRFFGQHDWYREGAQALINGQHKGNGYWLGAGQFENDPVISTCFALLFLSKGLSPVIINKLKYGPIDKNQEIVGDNWNKHHKDIRNLTEHISSLPKWPHLLSWQEVDFARLVRPGGGGLEDLQQAPVLYLSGFEAPVFTDEQIELLRQFVDQGGFIFAVANCNGAGFEDGMNALVKRMFLDGQAQLKRLTAEHPVYRSEYLLDADAVELYGVEYGCRTAIMYAPDDWSCLWDKMTRDTPPNRKPEITQRVYKASQVGVNVVAYATGRELLGKLDTVERAHQPGKELNIGRGLLEVAKLRHTGNWDAAPNSLKNLMMALNDTEGATASTRQIDFPASDPNVFSYPVLFMHGKNNFQLSRQEIDQLRKYLDQGGFLLSDSVCGSTQFDASFRALAKALYPEKTLERIPPDHEIFTTRIGHDIRKVKRRAAEVDSPNRAIETSVREVEPFLEGIEVDGRYTLIYSKYDISCALQRQASVACAGYVEGDAVKIGVNILRYALLQELGGDVPTK